ncbi:MAG TPA: signal peptidase I [Gemmatimonadaceae bacterium]|nr:signal peptidase I [Gemmatimonadaceae bacterium]
MTESVSLSNAAALEIRDPSWTPRPWRAAALSFFMPGLGQLYNGRASRALASVIVMQLWLVANIAATLVAPGRVLRVGLLTFGILAPLILLPWDAWRTARAMRAAKRRWFQRWYVLLPMLALWALAIQPQFFDLVRQRLAEAYRIPSGGMAPTLLTGDYLLVSKWDDGVARRGEVIVFNDETGRNYVQRVVGIPADTLAMRAHTLLVNGRAAPEPYARNDTTVDPAAREFDWQRAFLAASEDSSRYRPTSGNWGPLVIPRGHYFLLGDNRGSSYDSRYRGFVRAEEIRGRARWVYYSRAGGGAIQWSRIGVGIR